MLTARLTQLEGVVATKTAEVDTFYLMWAGALSIRFHLALFESSIVPIPFVSIHASAANDRGILTQSF